jgi:hypothetical protein
LGRRVRHEDRDAQRDDVRRVQRLDEVQSLVNYGTVAPAVHAPFHTGCVAGSDHQTGLMWEKLSDDGSIHDWDDTYTWDNAFAMKIATLNSTQFGGYNDWRLPNVNELQSLVNYSGVVPTVHAPFNIGCVAGCTVSSCSCTQPLPGPFYWSSTTGLPLAAHFAFQVRFDVGLVTSDFKTSSLRVRAVRGGV